MVKSVCFKLPNFHKNLKIFKVIVKCETFFLLKDGSLVEFTKA